MSSTRFRAGAPLDNAIDSLTANHVERSKEDPNYRYQLDMIDAATKVREQKTVSLNIDTRRAIREKELSDALTRENARRVALHLEPVESLDDIDIDDQPDVQLEQATKIVTDLAIMWEINAPPAQTAEVRP